MDIVKQYPVHEYTVSLMSATVSLCKTVITAETDLQGDVLHKKCLWRLALSAETPDLRAALAEHFDPAAAAFLQDILEKAAVAVTEKTTPET